jgi:hypothetical protein
VKRLSEARLEEILFEILGPAGRMIAASKADYCDRFPDHAVIFNANVCLSAAGKVWYGDLDLTLDEPLLQSVARQTGATVYVLHERDARFANERRPLISAAAYSVIPAGRTEFTCAAFTRSDDGSLRLRPVTQ